MSDVNPKCVRYIACNTAAELVEALGPTSTFFRNHMPYSWVFRGHKDYNQKLVPSALRSEDALSRIALRSCATNKEQIETELRILAEFFGIADLRGLPLPEDSQNLRLLINRLRDYIGFQQLLKDLRTGEASWPVTEFLSLTGLAQHYGLPTRLLDWSYSPFVAAYFAAIGIVTDAHAVPSKRELIQKYCRTAGIEVHQMACEYVVRCPGRLAVWAFSLNIDIAFQYGMAGPPPYRFITVPYAGNPNIEAQKGIFTVLTPAAIDPDSTVDRRPFNEILSEELQLRLGLSGAELFLCFHLDHSEAFELLRLLAKLGINASTIYPGYKGVSDTVAEKLWWWGKSKAEPGDRNSPNRQQ